MAEREIFKKFGEKTQREDYHEDTESYNVKYLTGRWHDLIYIFGAHCYKYSYFTRENFVEQPKK